MKKWWLGLLVIAAFGATFIALSWQEANHQTATTPKTATLKKKAGFNKKLYSIDTPGSLWWIVNKKRVLPVDYVPPGLTTPPVTLNNTKSKEENTVRQELTAPLQKLFADAKATGFDFMLASGYRSYQLQQTYYTNYVKVSGQTEADTYSARPGTSEHQTGLALDVARADRQKYLDPSFGEDPGGVWLAANAHKYGFIIRYPKGKEAITGYQYEPWHIRYVGSELANELYQKQQTMEEFFGL